MSTGTGRDYSIGLFFANHDFGRGIFMQIMTLVGCPMEFLVILCLKSGSQGLFFKLDLYGFKVTKRSIFIYAL